MSDRLQEIRARLDAATPGPWQVVCDTTSDVVGVIDGDYDAADFITHAPADIAWLLDREHRLMNALRVMTDLAEYDGGGIGRESLDEVLRDYGFSLDEIEANKENNSNG